MEKMDQPERQERDENAGAASKTESTGTELSEVKSWSTPGNRRMVLSKGGVSFVNSRKGGMNVRSSGIRVWSNGELTLKSKDIAGEGQKITAEAGDYVWIGSGSSGIAVLPDQIQISAANVYMESPLSSMHKTDDEESLEALLKKYEDAKASIAPPILTDDGKIITRDEYDDILYSQEMYDFFEENVVGKVPGYERKHDEPYATLFEQWLDETYGRSARGQFWDNIISIDTLQKLIGIGGLFFYQCDIANAAIYFLRQRWKESVFSLFSVILPLANPKAIKKLARSMSGSMDLATVLRSDDVVNDLYLIYLADENSMKLLSEIGPLTVKMLRNMRYSKSEMGIYQDILFKNLLVTIKVVNNVDEEIFVLQMDSKYVKDGAMRAAQYSSGWGNASLKEAIAKFAPNAEPVVKPNGKIIYYNPETGISVVYDIKGNYFRIEDTTRPRGRNYLDLEGNDMNNEVVNGKTRGRSKGDYQRATHFNNTDK